MRTIDEAIMSFHNRMVGRTVRGQIVECAEVIIDTNGRDDDPVRFFLHVVMRENPPGSDVPELRLVQRVFSEIPTHAMIRCKDMAELVARLCGVVPCADEEWRLSDELS